MKKMCAKRTNGFQMLKGFILAVFAGLVKSDREIHSTSAYITIEEGFYLSVVRDDVLRSFSASSPDLCGLSCMREPSCLSYNLAVNKEENGSKLCELLATNKYKHPKHLKRSDVFHHCSIYVSLLYRVSNIH